MTDHHVGQPVQVADGEWVPFPGGELEGKRPDVRCRACRVKGSRGHGTICFQCYRATLARERQLKAAGALDTASVQRFETTGPFAPIDHARVQLLRADRLAARAVAPTRDRQYADRRRQAQIAARHALQRIGAGLRTRAASTAQVGSSDGMGALDSQRLETIRATEMAKARLPESWLPFVRAQ